MAPPRPRILVFAYSDVGHACLSLLIARKANVIGVYTHADAPGETLWFPSVAELARSASIPVFTKFDLASPAEITEMQALAPELILSFYFRELLPPAVLELPRLGAFNMHGSLLPRFRGRAPVNWAVLHGETETGATLHVMTARADAGDIVDQQSVPIGRDDTAAVVQVRVRAAAVRVLDRQLEALERGRALRRAQKESKATKFGRRTPEDGRIDWSWPAQRVHDLVRAVSHPYPGAFADLLGTTTRIWATRVGEMDVVPGAAGDVRVHDRKLFVRCGDGRLLQLLRIQPEGEVEEDGGTYAKRLLDSSDRDRT